MRRWFGHWTAQCIAPQVMHGFGGGRLRAWIRPVADLWNALPANWNWDLLWMVAAKAARRGSCQ